MKISTNIVANCSDFVWTLNEPDIDNIRKAVKVMIEITNWKLCTSLEFIDGRICVPINVEDIELMEYEEEEGGDKYTELAVSLIKIFQKFDFTIKDKESLVNSQLYGKYNQIIDKTYFKDKNKNYIDVSLIDINHLPNEDGFWVFPNHQFSIPEVTIRYTDGYCDSKFVISENQPQSKELKFFGEILKNVGGTFHHEDGGSSQADWHAKWFNENGYGSILELGDGDPDNCDEDVND